jgi:hypothetical protein
MKKFKNISLSTFITLGVMFIGSSNVFAEEDWQAELKRELSQMQQELKKEQEELKRELGQMQQEIKTEVNSSSSENGSSNYKCGVNIEGDLKNTKIENEVIIDGKKVKDCKITGKNANIGGVVIEGGKIENSVIKNKTEIKNSQIIINGKRVK